MYRKKKSSQNIDDKELFERVIYSNRIKSLEPISLLHSKEFCNNQIKTSIYTIWNFVPKFFYEQFHQIANVFFGLSALTYIFAEGATSVFAIIGPLSAVMLLTMIKDAIFDIIRHRKDREINQRVFQYMHLNLKSKSIEWSKKTSDSLTVGDVILCPTGVEFPCDLLILASSSDEYVAKVNTLNLDGESALKTFYAIVGTQKIYQSYYDQIEWKSRNFLNEVKNLYIKLNCQNPCEYFNTFEGYIQMYENVSNEKQPVSSENLVLRGAKLSCTEWIIGLVVYTGQDTKLSLNSKPVKRKYSSREQKSNVILLGFIVFMLCTCILFAIVTPKWMDNHKNHDYIPKPKYTNWGQTQEVFRFYFIINALIPISIIITVDLIQIKAIYSISSDEKMKDHKLNLSSKATNSHIVDELGQIEFLFSDKTGTLTQNVMKLDTINLLQTNQIYKFTDNSLFEQSSIDDETNGSLKNLQIVSLKKLPEELSKFVVSMALCHTVEFKDHKHLNKEMFDPHNIVYEVSNVFVFY